MVVFFINAVIKTISLGYGFNAENDGTNVVVADGVNGSAKLHH